MKQFVVVRVGDLMDMRNPGWLNNDAGRIVYWQFQRESHQGSELSAEHHLYFAETLESANHLAKRLAETNVGSKYMVCEGSNVYECKAAPVMASKWSKAGLLPA